MSGNTIEAKLRIAAEVAQAITRLRELKREVLQTGDAIDKAGTGNGAAAGANKQQAEQATAATKAAAAASRAERQAEREANRLANAERVAADRAARQQRSAARREEAEEARRQRQVERREEAELTRQKQDAARKLRAEANLQANANRMLPAQVTDIVTSLSSGQAPLTVLIQQGGQLRDSYGSAGAAVKALLALLTPARVLIGGIAGAIAAVAGAATAGYTQTDKLNKSLVLTGDLGRASLGQIDGIARRIAVDQKTSVGSVRETLDELVSAGIVSARALDGAGRAATAYRKLTGASAADAAKLFEGQSGAVLDWATKANRAYNFLSAAQLAFIRNLQAQGRDSQAAQFANEELAKSLEQRSVPAIGAVERAWNKVGAVVGAIVDKVKGLGREATLEERMLAIQTRLGDIQAVKDNAVRRGATATDQQSPEEVDLRAQLEGLTRLQAMDRVRATERAAQQQAERDKALRQSKGYVDAEIALQAAGARKSLSQTEAVLARRQSDVEANVASRLISEQEGAEQLNAIDQARLQAQIAMTQRLRALEGSRVEETPLDGLAKSAALTQLDAQLTDLQARLTQSAAAGQASLANDSRQQAARWEKAWDEAAQRIRELESENDGAAAARVADPIERARAAGRQATEELRRDLRKQAADIELEVNRTSDPVRARQLQAQVAELRAQSATALNERRRQAEFQSLQESLAQQIEAQQLLEQDLAAMVDRGAIGTEEAEQRKLEARAGSIEQLQRILKLLQDIAATPADKAQVDAAKGTVRDMTDLRTELEKTARSSGISELRDGLTDIALGAKSTGNALRDMVAGFARALLNIINQGLAEKAFAFLKDLGKGSGGAAGGSGGWAAQFGSFIASFFHTGGVIGSGAGRLARVAMPLALAGAQVLHNGGLVLKPNERHVVAEVGEEMLTADDPRHVKNFRGAGLTMNAEFIFEGGGGSREEQQADAEELLSRMRMVCEQYVADQMRPGGRLSGVKRG